MFFRQDVSTQVGTMALVPQLVDGIKVPVIAAGGIVAARGIVAAFALGASAVQIGAAYLHCPEAQISAMHRQALKEAKDNETAITNVFTGRPARAIVNRLMREGRTNVRCCSGVSPSCRGSGGAPHEFRDGRIR